MSQVRRVQVLNPEDLQPEELESFLEAAARELLEGQPDPSGRRPVGLMHHHGAARRFGSSPGGGPLTGLNTAAFARV